MVAGWSFVSLCNLVPHQAPAYSARFFGWDRGRFNHGPACDAAMANDSLHASNCPRRPSKVARHAKLNATLEGHGKSAFDA